MRKGGDKHDSDSIVVKDRGDIFRWEFVCCVADEQTCLSYSSITNNHTSARGLAIQFRCRAYLSQRGMAEDAKRVA